MKKIWKRSAAWVTDLRSNLFTWTRIKLTLLYLLIIVVALVVYSTALYYALLTNVRHEVVTTVDQAVRHQIFDSAIDAIQLQVFLIDIVTFSIAAIGSYWLAGINLRPIKQALEAQEAFSSDASHELRTPLAVMKTDIEVLLRNNTGLDQETRSVLKSNLEEIQTLSLMTQELLDLARGKQREGTAVALDDIVRQEVAALQTLAQQKGNTLNVEGKSARIVVASTETIQRIIKNVVANAVTYTEKGTITVSLKDHERSTVIAIKDTGIGIKKEDLPHIFKRLYKASNADAGGSGLGLAIVKQLVEQCNGTVSAQSTLGQGTTMTIVLPSRPA